jgi:hypothetical protein
MSRDYYLWNPIPIKDIKEDFYMALDANGVYLLDKNGTVGHLPQESEWLSEVTFYGMNDESNFLNLMTNKYYRILYNTDIFEMFCYKMITNENEFLWAIADGYEFMGFEDGNYILDYLNYHIDLEIQNKIIEVIEEHRKNLVLCDEWKEIYNLL